MAPLTMSPERAEDIEFTKPYKYQGITILIQQVRCFLEVIPFERDDRHCRLEHHHIDTRFLPSTV